MSPYIRSLLQQIAAAVSALVSALLAHKAIYAFREGGMANYELAILCAIAIFLLLAVTFALVKESAE